MQGIYSDQGLVEWVGNELVLEYKELELHTSHDMQLFVLVDRFFLSEEYTLEHKISTLYY